MISFLEYSFRIKLLSALELDFHTNWSLQRNSINEISRGATLHNNCEIIAQNSIAGLYTLFLLCGTPKKMEMFYRIMYFELLIFLC